MTPNEMIKELKSELKEYKKTKEYRTEKYVKGVLKDMTEEELYPNFKTSGDEESCRNPKVSGRGSLNLNWRWGKRDRRKKWR